MRRLVRLCSISTMGGVFFLVLFILASCSNDETEPVSEPLKVEEPKLLSVGFRMLDNPLQIVEDVSAEIIGDSVVECWIRYLVSDKRLVPSFEYQGDSLVIENIKYCNGTILDFKKPVKIKVFSRDRFKSYNIYVYSFTGLPVIWIDTEGRKDITSKEDYITACFKLQEDIITREPGDIIEDSVKIKGRGNSTWNAPKKPYRLKFDKKQSLLGDPKDKSWVLLANYYDMTMLRNQTAFYMSSISNIEYTPKAHFVELMLNGKYNGTYQLCEKLKIGNNRVNVGNDGFLLEVDERAVNEGAIYFYTNKIAQPISVKEPDVEFNDENYNYIKDFLLQAENALFSEHFRDTNKGWQKFMDKKSFVDFFIINEIAKNGDVCTFYTSCYMNLKRGGGVENGSYLG